MYLTSYLHIKGAFNNSLSFEERWRSERELMEFIKHIINRFKQRKKGVGLREQKRIKYAIKLSLLLYSEIRPTEMAVNSRRLTSIKYAVCSK
jgi:hypothetical protein